jgi:hypothetical protein
MPWEKNLIATSVLIMENWTGTENVLTETPFTGGSLAFLTLTGFWFGTGKAQKYNF